MQLLVKRNPIAELIWQTPVYRAAIFTLFCAGLGVSAAIPLFTLFLIEELHASLAVAGLYFVTALFGPVVSMITGRLSDRLPDRRRLIQGAACWLAVGWLLMAVAQQIWMAFAISIVFISFMGTFSAQLFAAVRDEVVRTGDTRESQLVSTIRAAYSLGWIIGPVVGSWIGLTIGLRQLFIGTAILYLVSQLPFLTVRPSSRQDTASSIAPQQHHRESAIPLLVFSGLCALVMSSETLKLSFLPVYMERELAMPAWMSGVVISTQPLLELVMIPAAGIIAARVGPSRVLMVGVGLGAIGHSLFAFSNAPWMLFLGQLFVGMLVSVILGLGVTVAQDLYRSGSGFASSAFFGALGLSATAGGLIGSLGVSQLGLPAVFIVPAALCILTVIGLASLDLEPSSTRQAQHPQGVTTEVQ